MNDNYSSQSATIIIVVHQNDPIFYHFHGGFSVSVPLKWKLLSL